jgi:hypothetical protein
MTDRSAGQPILAEGSPPLTLESGVAALWLGQFMRSEVWSEPLPSSLAPLIHHCETTLSVRYPALSRQTQEWIASAPSQVESLLQNWGRWSEMTRQGLRNRWSQDLTFINHALGLPDLARFERNTKEEWANLAGQMHREGKIDDAGLLARLDAASRAGFQGAMGIAGNIR